MKGQRIDLTYEARTDLCQRYLAGEGARSIGTSLGMSRSAVLRQLRDMGVSVRTVAQANKVRQDNLSPEVRREHMAHANAVRLSRLTTQPRNPVNPKWMRKSALIARLAAAECRVADLQAVCSERQAELVQLRSQVATLARDLAAAREALAAFGKHPSGCPAWRTVFWKPPLECTCGLAAALADAPEDAKEVE